MLDFDWMINTLKEAIEDEDWELVREVIAYLFTIFSVYTKYKIVPFKHSSIRMLFRTPHDSFVSEPIS